MMPVTQYVHSRSLGLSCKRSLVPLRVPHIDIQLLVDANAGDGKSCVNVLDHVVLGFVPGYPDTLLVIRNPLRLGDELDSSSDRIHNIATTSFWTVNFHNLKITTSQSSWTMPSDEFRTLISCSSAFFGTPRKLLQVTCYCPDQEQDSGFIRLKRMTVLPSQPHDWYDAEAVCSTTEIVSAVTCFAHCAEYVTVLLRTRCIFFVMKCPDVITSHNLFWTTDTDAGSAKHCMVRIFEFDIFVEQLLTKQQTSFGHNQTARWSYVTILDTRNHQESLRQAQKVCEQRRYRINLENGSIFFIGVLGDDLKSILLLTVLIDPTPIRDGYRDHVVLEGRRWTLAKQTTESPHKVINSVIGQTHDLPQHDCALTCCHTEVETKVLATYESEGAKSLDLIEGEYWIIVGTTWNDD